jgi:hypothetical protein
MENSIPEENTAPTQPAPVGKTPLVASIRFKNEAQAKRFFAVYNNRKNARRAKDRSESVSDFLQHMFDYVEHNPYGDFYTGK